MAAGDNLSYPHFENTGTPRWTGRASALVRGSRFVVCSGAAAGGMAGTENVPVAEAGAAAAAIGVSVYECPNAELVPMINGGAVTPVMSGAAVTAGQAVASDAQGRAIPWVSPAHKLGVAWETVAAADLPVAVQLTIS